MKNNVFFHDGKAHIGRYNFRLTRHKFDHVFDSRVITAKVSNVSITELGVLVFNNLKYHDEIGDKILEKIQVTPGSYLKKLSVFINMDESRRSSAYYDIKPKNGVYHRIRIHGSDHRDNFSATLRLIREWTREYGSFGSKIHSMIR